MEKPQIINNLNFAINEIIRKQWSSSDDYWYISILQRKKDNDKVLDKYGKSIFVRGTEKWIDGDFEDNRIGYAIIKGNTVEEAINSLLTAKITIFDSWIDFTNGQKYIEGNNGEMGNIISVCRMFNARAYMSMYKRSFSENSKKELPSDMWTPKILQQNLIGKTDASSRERVFDFVSTRKPRKNLPYWFIDCDDESEEINKKIYEYITKNCKIEPKVYQTHNGFHYLIDMSNFSDDKKMMSKIKNDLNIFIHEELYGNKIKYTGEQNNPVQIEDDKKIILYSEVGVEDRNVEHPDWQTNDEYPAYELRSKIKKAKNATNKVLKKYFVIKTKNGETFKYDASSRYELVNALKKRFPMMKNDTINLILNNPKNYITESNINYIIRNVLNEYINKEINFINENYNDEAFKRTEPMYYSADDKLSLVKDPYDSLDKSQQHGNMRNFAIKRNGKVYWVARSMAVQCCVFCKDANGEWCLLASKRGGTGDRSGQWNIVGGFLDYGENLEMAVARECHEETGVDIPVESVKYLGHHAPVGDGPVDIFFKAILNGTTDMYNAPTLQNCEGYGTDKQESTNVGWIPISQLKNYNFVSRQRKYIQQLVNELSATNYSNNAYSDFVKSLSELLKNGNINSNIYNKIIKLVNYENN